MLKGSCTDSVNNNKKICTKILDRKMHRPHLLMLEQLPEKQKPAGTLPGSWYTGGGYFCNLILPWWCWHMWVPFWNPSCSLLELSGVLESSTQLNALAGPHSQPHQGLVPPTSVSIIEESTQPKQEIPWSSWLWRREGIVLLDSIGHLLCRVFSPRSEYNWFT